MRKRRKTLVQRLGLLGIVERFSVFAATGFNAELGVLLFCAQPDEKQELKQKRVRGI